MAINRVEIKDYLVFKGEFSADFCLGVNVFIGGNGTGKTTLLRCLYELNQSYARLVDTNGYTLVDADGYTVVAESESEAGAHKRSWGTAIVGSRAKNYIYIPEKDILEHAKGLLPFIEQKDTGFSSLYKKVLISAQDIPTKTQSSMQKSIGQKISSIIGGYIEWVPSEGVFYMIKSNGYRIPFSNEASGFKRLGFLALLVTSGQLETNSVLFWDEPENSLNPEYIPVIVDILLELANSGVQIFIATHSYTLTRFFDVREDKSIDVCFHNMSKSEADQIICDSSPQYIKLVKNILEDTAGDVFEAVIKDARKYLLEADEDE